MTPGVKIPCEMVRRYRKVLAAFSPRNEETYRASEKRYRNLMLCCDQGENPLETTVSISLPNDSAWQNPSGFK